MTRQHLLDPRISLVGRLPPEATLVRFGRLLPVACLSLLVLATPRLGAEPPVLPAVLDPVVAIHDEAEALAPLVAEADTRDASLERVESLLVELVGLGGGEWGSPAQRQVLEELVGLRFTALTTTEPLPEGARGAFLTLVAPGAMVSDVVMGVPASITLSQAIIESGWGKTAPGHNLFGMKGEGPAGSTSHVGIEYRDGKRVHRRSSFRSYHSYAESIEDHARLLTTRARYAATRAVSEDPPAYAKALQGKYATDPRYAAKLMDISTRYNLARFDWAMPDPPSVAEVDEP